MADVKFEFRLFAEEVNGSVVLRAPNPPFAISQRVSGIFATTSAVVSFSANVYCVFGEARPNP